MSEKKTPARRYHLISNDPEVANERIITATSRAQALSHAAMTDWSIKVLDVENAIRLSREGVLEETAGTDATDPDQLPLPIEP